MATSEILSKGVKISESRDTQGAKDDKKAMELYGLSCDYGYDMGCAKFRELVKKSK